MKNQNAAAAVSSKFQPKFEGAVEGFVVNWIKKNHWKVDQQLPERDDVLQEAYCVFLKISNQYPDIDNAAWFQSMFMKSFSDRMIDCSRKQIRHKEHFADSDVLMSDGEESLSLTEQMVGDLDTEASLERLVEQADGEVAEVLRTVMNMPNEVFAMIEEAWVSRGKRKVMGNQMLCALLGKDATKTNLVKKVEDHFISN